MATTKTSLILLLFVIQHAAAVTHSLKYFQTATSGIPEFPTFVSVELVDDVQISLYDSNTGRVVPKQEWVKRVTEKEPRHWDHQTDSCRWDQHLLQVYIDTAKQRFNQDGGVHIYQKMYGCEWDDETQQVTGYEQHGYDGEDFITWNMETNTFIASKQQAQITTNEWNNDKFKLEERKNYFNQICPEWLKKYVDYGRSSLTRTERPSVSFLQKKSSSPVSCHATGFYPNRAEMFWRKDGEEIHDGVVKGEILPNNDGSFQMTVDLDLSSVAFEDWSRYECVFQLSGVNDDITHRLDKSRILTNGTNMMMIIAVVAAVAVLGLIGVIGFILYKKNTKGLKPEVYKTSASCPETSSLTSDGSDDSKDSVSSQKRLRKAKKTNQ